MLDDLIQGALGDKLPEWTSILTERAGFDAGQAVSFVPALLEKIGGLFGDGGLDLADGFDVSKILGSLDLGSLAEKVGIGTDQAKSGVQELLPDLTSTLTEKVGDVSGLLDMLQGEGDGGGLLGKLGDLLK